MNIPSANDDEDFPVFKAGPPLPIRTKTKPNCKIKSVPLKATTSISPRSSSKTGTSMTGNTSINTESKVKQYIEKVKASDEVGRKKRIKPETMLSLEELYQVNLDSKLESQCDTGRANKNEPCVTEVQDKLRETLRIMKEKDELINKLRESCHDLAIKCADAENRVDELRFSYGRSSFSGCTDKENSRKKSADEQHLSQYSAVIPRRCVSAEGLHKCGLSEDDERNREKIDKATETNHGGVIKYDAETQIEVTPCRDGRFGNERLSEQEAGQWQTEDDILQETCSNWLEKVQNWKTDSNFNLSQDSGGDKDSGFRGSSAEIDAESILKNRHLSHGKSHRKCQGHGERLLKVPQYSSRNTTAQLPQTSSTSTTTITAQPTCNHHYHHLHDNLKEEQSQQHFWPSFSSSQSHFNLSNYHSGTFHSDSTKAKSLFYEMAETNRNKNACFQEDCLEKHKLQTDKLGGAKSLDVLYFPPAPHQTTEELRSLIDSSFDPPEFILKSHLNSQHRSIDKKVKILGPLLDDTTQLALRVKMKTERLAKMLNDACSLET